MVGPEGLERLRPTVFGLPIPQPNLEHFPKSCSIASDFRHLFNVSMKNAATG
jgi:hypothetical protein